MPTAIIHYSCDLCRCRYKTLAEATKCENQKSPIKPSNPIGSTVKLDARGLKDGNAYIVATVMSYKLMSRGKNHYWEVQLDRSVCLHEVWGEDGESEVYRSCVDVAYILPDDLSQADSSWWGDTKSQWADVTKEYSR